MARSRAAKAPTSPSAGRRPKRSSRLAKRRPSSTSTGRTGTSRPAARTKGMSLHIGLNSVNPKHYAGWSGDLVACEFDAQDMASLASAHNMSSAATTRTTRRTKRGASTMPS